MNLEHAAVYFVTSLLLLAFSFQGESTAPMGLYLTAGLVLLVAVLGYRELDSRPYSNASILGVILYNRADLWLDVGLGVTLILCGLMNTSKGQILRD